MKKNKNGFTLMELLAVIVVIAVIAIITVPSILGVIERVNKAAFKDSVLGYIESAQMYLTTNIGSINENDEYVFICDGISCSTKNGDKLNFKGSVPKSGIISIKGNGEVTVENLYNGRYYANKDEEGTVIVDNEVPDTLSRDELTKLVYELKEEVKNLKRDKANQTDLEAVSTVAQSAKTIAENATTNTEMEAINTVVKTNQSEINTLKEKHSKDINTINANVSANTKSIVNLTTASNTHATKTELEAVATVANSAKDLANKSATQTNVENIATIANEAKELASKAATASSLESVSTIANEAKTLASKAATQTDLDAVSTIAKNAQTLASKAATASSLESVSTIANNAKKIAEGAQTALASKVSKEEATLASHPVGSIFVSTVYDTKEKVSEALGGTWEVYGSGRTLVGADGTTYKAGNTGGSSSVTLSVANLPSHNHTFTGTAKNYTSGNQSQGHTHSIPALSGSTNPTGAHSHTLTSYLAGTTPAGGTTGGYAVSGGAGVVNWWNGNSTNTAGNHYHTVSTNASTTEGISANHTHTTTVTPEGTIGSTGSGEAFSVQNPYVVVYMYKRVS